MQIAVGSAQHTIIFTLLNRADLRDALHGFAEEFVDVLVRRGRVERDESAIRNSPPGGRSVGSRRESSTTALEPE